MHWVRFMDGLAEIIYAGHGNSIGDIIYFVFLSLVFDSFAKNLKCAVSI